MTSYSIHSQRQPCFCLPTSPRFGFSAVTDSPHAASEHRVPVRRRRQGTVSDVTGGAFPLRRCGQITYRHCVGDFVVSLVGRCGRICDCRLIFWYAQGCIPRPPPPFLFSFSFCWCSFECLVASRISEKVFMTFAQDFWFVCSEHFITFRIHGLVFRDV